MAYYQCSKPSKKYSIRADIISQGDNSGRDTTYHHYLRIFINNENVASSNIGWSFSNVNGAVGYELST